MATKPQESACLGLPSAGVAVVIAGDLNSGSHTCMADTLLMESLSQSLVFAFCHSMYVKLPGALAVVLGFSYSHP